jgi:hypothetical protein
MCGLFFIEGSGLSIKLEYRRKMQRSRIAALAALEVGVDAPFWGIL